MQKNEKNAYICLYDLHDTWECEPHALRKYSKIGSYRYLKNLVEF